LPTDSCTRPVLCAVCLPEESSRALTGVVFGLKKSLYGIPSDPTKLVELHGHKFLTRQTFNRAARGFGPAKRALKLFDGVMDACQNVFSSMKAFAVVMERPTFRPFYPDKHLSKECTNLLQRISSMMDEDYPEKMATMIFDEQDLKGDMKRAFAFGQYFFTSVQGRACRKILDTPFFVASQTCSGLQVADIFARIIRLYHEADLANHSPVDDFEKAVAHYYEIVVSKTKDYTHPVSQVILPGFYQMPMSAFPRPPDHS